MFPGRTKACQQPPALAQQRLRKEGDQTCISLIWGFDEYNFTSYNFNKPLNFKHNTPFNFTPQVLFSSEIDSAIAKQHRKQGDRRDRGQVRVDRLPVEAIGESISLSLSIYIYIYTYNDDTNVMHILCVYHSRRDRRVGRDAGDRRDRSGDDRRC